MIRSVARGVRSTRTKATWTAKGQRIWPVGGPPGEPGAPFHFSKRALVTVDGAEPLAGNDVPPGGLEPQPVTASRAARTIPQRARRPGGRRIERSTIGLDLHIMAWLLSSREF